MIEILIYLTDTFFKRLKIYIQPQYLLKFVNFALVNQISTLNDKRFQIQMFKCSDQTNLKNNKQVVLVEDTSIIYTPEGKKIYKTNEQIDRYHFGSQDFSHLKDLTIGGDLPNGGVNRAIEEVKKLKEKKEMIFGVEMTEEGWKKFKIYLKEIIEGESKNPRASKIKLLKFLYGVDGYGKTLLMDSFPSIYTKDQMIKELEELIVEAKDNEKTWIENLLIKIRRETEVIDVNVNPRFYKELKEIIDDIESEEKIPMNERIKPVESTDILEEIPTWKSILSEKKENGLKGEIEIDKKLLDNLKQDTDWKSQNGVLIPYPKNTSFLYEKEKKEIPKNTKGLLFKKGIRFINSQLFDIKKFQKKIGTRLFRNDKDDPVTISNVKMEQIYKLIDAQAELATKRIMSNPKDPIHVIVDIEANNSISKIMNDQEKRKFYQKVSENIRNSEVKEEEISEIKEDSKELEKKFPEGKYLNLNEISYQITEDKWEKNSMKEFALGENPSDTETRFKKISIEYCEKELKGLGYLMIPKNNLIEKPITASLNEILFPRVQEIIKEKEELKSLINLENIIESISQDHQIKSTKGEIIPKKEKDDLENLKKQVQEKRKNIEKIKIYETLTPIEQARMEIFGYIKNEKQNNFDLKQLDLYLDQINKEFKRDIRSKTTKKDDPLANINPMVKDLINEYSQLRLFYSQLQRNDSSLRDWQSLTAKEKTTYEKQFQKNFGLKYQDLIMDLTQKMQSAQFAESLTIISAAIENLQPPKESNENLMNSYKEMQREILKITNDFYLDIDRRYQIKEKALMSRLTDREIELRKNYNFNHYLDNQLDLRDPNKFQKRKEELLSKDLTLDELTLIVKKQIQAQNKWLLDRLKKEKKVDPETILFQFKLEEFLTLEQKLLIEKLKEKKFNEEMENWKKSIENKTLLTTSPMYFIKNFKKQGLNESLPSVKIQNQEFQTNWSIEEWLKHFQMDPKTINQMNESLFPEKPWDGDYQTLQLLYFYLQLQRSHDPRYTRSIDFLDGEGFANRALWRGIWMIPESLSNFLHVRDPPPPKLVDVPKTDDVPKVGKKPDVAKPVEPPPKPFSPPIRVTTRNIEIPPQAVTRQAPDLSLVPQIVIPQITPNTRSSRVIQERPPEIIPGRDRLRHVGVEYEPALWKSLQDRLFGTN